jgi:hypothetical protein
VSGEFVVGLFTLAGVALAQAFAAWQRKRDREETARQRQEDREERLEQRAIAGRERWLEPAATTLGRTREFLSDINPMGTAFNLQKEKAEEVTTEYMAGWGEIRDSLAALEMGHPSREVRDLTAEVSAGSREVLNLVTWLIRDLVLDRDVDEWLKETGDEWRRVYEKVKELREALHESPPSPEPS